MVIPTNFIAAHSDFILIPFVQKIKSFKVFAGSVSLACLLVGHLVFYRYVFGSCLNF